jgi:hypothetical protein
MRTQLVVPAALPRLAVALPVSFDERSGETVVVPPAPGDALAGLVDALAADLAKCLETAQMPFALERRSSAQVARDAARTPEQAPRRTVLGIALPASSVVTRSW